MFIYIFAFIVCMLLGIVMLPKNSLRKDSVRKKQSYLIFVTLFLGLIAGFRSLSVGYDTYSYSLIFDEIWIGSLKQILDSASRLELGFVIWCAIIKGLGGGYQWLLISTSLFIMASFSIFVFRHSKSILWSIFVLLCFQYYYSSFDIMRHFMATSFLLLGYKYVEQRRIVPFLLYILLGSLFHKVAFIFIMFYFIPLIKWNKVMVFIGIIAILILNLFVSRFSVELGLLLGKGDYTQSHDGLQWVGAYSGGEKTFFLFLIVFLLMYYAYGINSKLHLVNEKTNNISLTLCFLMVMFSFFFINAMIMTRFIMTSSAFLAIALPNILIPDGQSAISHSKLKKIALIVVFLGITYNIFLLSMNWQNIVPYIPFWQQ